MLLTGGSADIRSRQGNSQLKDASYAEDASTLSKELKLSLVRYNPTGYYFGTISEHKRSGVGVVDLQTTPGYYEGQFEDDLMHGVGLLQVKGKPTYLGGFAHGLPAGVGAQFCPQFTHVGSFLYGARDGFGESYTQSGIRITGNFTSAGLRGYGEIKDANNHVTIQGNYVEGKLDGLAFKSGPKAKYFGYFKQGLRDGPGVMYDHSGNLLSAAIYESGSFSKYGIFPLADYEGEVDAIGQPEGYGRETKGYVGEYARGLRNGLGKQTSADGQEAYTGNWVNSTMEGLGYLSTPTESYFGHFKRGLKDGFGYEVSTKTNREYLGYYVHGVKHGVAIVRIPSKEEKAARFSNNKLVEILPDSEVLSLRTSNPLDFRAFAGQTDSKLQKILRFLDSQSSQFAGLRSADDIAQIRQRFDEQHAELEAAVAEQKTAFENAKDSFDMLRFELAACLGDGHNRKGVVSAGAADGLARIRTEEAARYRNYLRELELAPVYLPVEHADDHGEWSSPTHTQPKMIEMSAFSFDKDFGNLALAPGGLLDSSPMRKQTNMRDFSSLSSPNRDRNHSASRIPRSTSREDSVEFVDGPFKSKVIETSKQAPSIRQNYRSFQNYMLDAIFLTGLEEFGKSEGIRMDILTIGGKNIDLELLFCPEKVTTQFFKADQHLSHFDIAARSLLENPLESLDRVEFSTPHRKSPSVDHYIGLIDRLEVVPPSQSTDRLLQASTQAVERHSKQPPTRSPEVPASRNPEGGSIHHNQLQPPPEKSSLILPPNAQHPGEISSRTLEQFEFDPLDLPPPPASKPARRSIAQENFSQDGASESMPSMLGKDTIPESDDILPIQRVAIPGRNENLTKNPEPNRQANFSEPEGTRTSFGHKVDLLNQRERQNIDGSGLQEEEAPKGIDKSSREVFAAKRAESQKQQQRADPQTITESDPTKTAPGPTTQAGKNKTQAAPNTGGEPEQSTSKPGADQSKELLEERTRLEKLKIQLEIELLKVQLEAVRKEKDIYQGNAVGEEGVGYTYRPPEQGLDLP